MEENQRPSSVDVAANFDDIFKSVEDVNKETEVTQEQQTTEEVKPTTEVAPIQTEVQPQVYKDRLNLLIEDGVLENFAIGITDENGERQEVFLADLKEVDQDMYKAILANYKEAKDKEISEKYIPVDGMNETTKKLLEVTKAGGDITEIVKENVTALNQWQKTKDSLTDNEQLQMDVIAWDLKQRGLSDKVIKAQIEDYVENLQLDVEAEKIVNFHLGTHQQEIEAKKEAELKRLEDEKNNQKQLRKTLSTKYKELGVPEASIKVLVDNATKQDSQGITNTESLFFQAIQDPEKFAEINYFLNDREGFIRNITGKKVLQAKTENFKTMFDVNLKAVKPTKTEPVSVNDMYDEVFQKQ